MSFTSKSNYFAGRAAISRAASSAAVDPAIAYAHRELAIRYEAVCEHIASEGGENPDGSMASHAESVI